jgi:hypothetical protein
MIKYNWEKILEITEADAGSIILIVHMLTYPRVPYNFKDPSYKYYGQTFEGFSYLLNPEELLRKRANYSNQEIAEYVGVASYRNYNDYKENGETNLPLINLPMLAEIFENNRLLHFKDGMVHFKYE